MFICSLALLAEAALDKSLHSILSSKAIMSNTAAFGSTSKDLDHTGGEILQLIKDSLRIC